MEALYGVLHRKGMGGLCYDMESFPVRPRYVDPMLPRFVADLISTMGPVEIAEGSQKTVFIPVLPHPGAEFDFGVPHVRYAAPGVEPANLDGWCTEDLHSADVDIALHKLYCSRVDFRGKVSSPWWLMQVVQNGDQGGFRILSPLPLEVLDPISKVALLTLKTNITRSVAVTSLGGDKRFHEEIPSGPADFGDAYIKKWKLNRGGTEHAIIRIRDEDKAAYDALPDQAGGKIDHYTGLVKKDVERGSGFTAHFSVQWWLYDHCIAYTEGGSLDTLTYKLFRAKALDEWD